LIHVILAMSVVSLATMPETAVEEVGGDAHHHLIDVVDAHTLEVAPEAAHGPGDMDLGQEAAPDMIPAHGPGTDPGPENGQYPDLLHPEGAALAQDHQMAEIDHQTVHDR